MDESPLLRAAATLLFAVDLDGRPIGTHEFRVEARDETVNVRSLATFDVRLLGIRVYRYRHESVETWDDGCLRALSASTDDHGRRTTVVASPSPDGGLRIVTNGATSDARGCIRAFAYWRPEWLAAPTLLNPQTGRLDEARWMGLGDEPLVLADGRSVSSRRWRLRAGGLDIDLWYDGAGDWLQLVSSTADGRRLRYRRQ